MKSRRAATILAVWLICVIASRLTIPRRAAKSLAATTPSLVSSQEDEHFTLCNRKLYFKDLPPGQPEDNAPFGVREWNRDLNKAIAIEHRGLPGGGSQDGIRPYGRTGNQIQTFFHAFDMARDNGGALVLRQKGFPIDFVLDEIFLGVNKTVLQEKFGITIYESIAEDSRSNIKTIGTGDLYHFISKDPRFSMVDVIEHRHYAIQQLYQITAAYIKLHPNSDGEKSMCSSLHAFFGEEGEDKSTILNRLAELGMRDITNKYTVIHARTLEGFGPAFMRKAHEVWGVDPLIGKEYPPDLVSTILTPLGMHNSSILMITDGKNRRVMDILKNDPAIGPYFQVVPPKVSTVTGDMLLAIFAEVFIGNPCSTFSQYIAQVRYALGIGNSYIFAKRDGPNWETFCSSDEACFYQWQHTWIPLF